MKTLKTITLTDKQGNPAWTLCPGHVSAKTFNKAFKAEGWNTDPYLDKDLYFQYWRKLKSGMFKKCSPEAKGAKPYTTTEAW